MLRALVAISALACPGLQAADAVDVADDPALEVRVNAVSAELRCLVCQNQSLADSHAGLAIDLKNQVREQLKAGRTEAQVVDYMTARYGDFVRYRPPLKAATLLLWAGPLLLVLAGAWALWRGLPRTGTDDGADHDGLPDADRLPDQAAADKLETHLSQRRG